MSLLRFPLDWHSAGQVLLLSSRLADCRVLHVYGHSTFPRRLHRSPVASVLRQSPEQTAGQYWQKPVACCCWLPEVLVTYSSCETHVRKLLQTQTQHPTRQPDIDLQFSEAYRPRGAERILCWPMHRAGPGLLQHGPGN